MNCVVDSVETCCLGVLCDTELVLASANLSCYACLKVRLCVAEDIAKELCKLACMLCLLECITLVCLCNLWITLTVSLARHGEIHTNLCTLTVEMCVEVLYHLLVSACCLCDTKLMDCGKDCLVVILHL